MSFSIIQKEKSKNSLVPTAVQQAYQPVCPPFIPCFLLNWVRYSTRAYSSPLLLLRPLFHHYALSQASSHPSFFPGSFRCYMRSYFPHLYKTKYSFDPHPQLYCLSWPHFLKEVAGCITALLECPLPSHLSHWCSISIPPATLTLLDKVTDILPAATAKGILQFFPPLASWKHDPADHSSFEKLLPIVSINRHLSQFFSCLLAAPSTSPMDSVPLPPIVIKCQVFLRLGVYWLFSLCIQTPGHLIHCHCLYACIICVCVMSKHGLFPLSRLQI